MRPAYLSAFDVLNSSAYRAAPMQSCLREAVILCALAVTFLAGCAAPGEPSARHPVVPEAVGDLAAHQEGAGVVLTFTLPKHTAAKGPLPEIPAIEIYRGTRKPGEKGKIETRLIYRIPPELVNTYLQEGKIDFRDTLEAKTDRNVELDYAVRTRLQKKAASAESNVVAVQVLPAPVAPTAVRANVTEAAIEVTWTPPGSDIFGGALTAPIAYRVYRGELEPGATPPGDISQAKLHAPLALLGPSATTTFRDEHFAFGSTYVYTVRAVVGESGHEVESADAVPVSVAAADVFPPATPAGLVETVVPSTNLEAAHVELSWSISPETDLAGYWVYRSEDSGTLGQRLNTQPLLSPAFRDMTAVTGKRYFYRVSAMDRSGNESPLSSPVSAEISQ